MFGTMSTMPVGQRIHITETIKLSIYFNLQFLKQRPPCLFPCDCPTHFTPPHPTILTIYLLQVFPSFQRDLRNGFINSILSFSQTVSRLSFCSSSASLMFSLDTPKLCHRQITDRAKLYISQNLSCKIKLDIDQYSGKPSWV